MFLTLEQIQSITTGAVSVVKEEDGIHFRRFTDRQLEVFRQKSAQFQQRSHCTAGCRLSFYTDADTVILTVGGGAKFEVLINGLPAYFFPLEKPQRIPFSLTEGENLVVITLPNYSEGVLNSLELDEGASFRPYEYSRRFLFLGDSITQGSQSTRDSFCYVNRVSQFFDAETMNLGVGGSFMLAETLEDVGFDPDAVFIAYGTNDYKAFSSIEELEAACKAYFKGVQEIYRGKKIFYISPLWRADGSFVCKTGTLDDCRKVFIEQANTFGFIHIDGYSLIPHMPHYLNDGYLHPNDIGFSYYSENLIRFLLNHL